MLLMALSNEHLLTFNQYKDAKTLFEAIKQDLVKNVSQLAILDENISQEDLNMKFLRRLHAEWNTHVVVWRNKVDLDTMRIDYLYNNFKFVEQEVKRRVVSSSSSGSPNMEFLSSPGSTNEADTASIQVGVISTPVSTVSSPNNTANLSDATVYAFLENQPNGSQLVHKDLEQIHEDDLEKMDLKWSDTAGYDKTKVECFNCHKMGHFARECKSPRNQENRPRNQENLRKTVIMENTPSKAMVAIDGAGFDWSYMADDEVPTNMALMVFSDSESLDKLIGSQITDNSKTGLGFINYNVVAPPPIGLFAPPSIDLSNSGLEEFQQPEFEGYGPKTCKSVSVDTSNEIKKAPDAPIIKDWVSDSDEDESKEMVLEYDIVQHKPKQANQPKNVSQNPRNIRTNRNEIKTQKLGVGFQFTKKACFVCGSFSHLIKDCDFHDKRMGAPQDALKDQGHFGSGCFKHMTENISYLTDFKEHDGGYVAFGGGAKGGKITGKGTIRTGKLDFEDVYFVKELQFNLFSVSQMCDKKNSVLFTDTECFVLSSNFKLVDESQVLIKVPRKNNMYSFDMKNIVPQKDLTCLLAKATNDESMLWHRRLETKDETSRILKSFITEIENLVEKKVKIIRCDNRTEFKNRVMNEFCEQKDSKLPTTFWAEAVSTACYVQNRILVVKPHFKTPYGLFKGRSPALSFMRPFGCHVSILNTLDQLKKFDGKSDEGIFVGYSTTSKAFRVYNIRTRKVEENLHITFLENKHMITGGGPEWLFDLDAISKSINYAPVFAGTNFNDFAGKGASFDADNSLFDSSSQASDSHNKDKHGPSQATESDNHERPNAESSTKTVNTVGPVNTADYPNNSLMPDLEDVGIFDDAYDDRDEGVEADYNNLKTVISVSHIPSIRIYKDYPKEHIIGEVNTAVQTRKMAKQNETGLISFINKQRRINHKDFQNCLFACFLSQMEPKKLLNVWTLVDLPPEKRPIGTKWVYRNKRDQRGIVVRNKARLVAQVHRQEEGIDYDEVFAPVARIEAIRPDIMVSVCACSRFQVQQKVSHMHAVKRIFRYLKGQPTLGLSYPKDSPLELIAYSDSDYVGASLDIKSTTRGCQFLGSRLIFWQCKKQTIMANSTTEAEYITNIHVDNESAICVVKNLVYHSKTKHIEIRHHFIRGSYEKRLIEMVKIHIDYNVVDLLTKVFDVTRVNIKESSIRRILRLDDAEASKEVGILQADAQPIPIPTEPSTSKPQKQYKPKRKHTKEPEVPPTESQAEHNIPLPSPSHDPLPSGEDSLKLKELIDLCISFSNKVLDLESEVLDIKSTYTTRIEKLESRVERLEEENRVLKELKGVHSTVDSDEPILEKEESSKQRRKIAYINADVLSMLDVNDEEPVDVKEVLEAVKASKLITKVVTTAGVDVNAAIVQDTPITAAEATKVIVPRKRRGVIIQDPEETITTVTVQPKVQAKDKRKAILIEEPKPLERQVQIDLDEEVARQLKAELNADINWNAMIEQHFNYNQAFLNEVNERIKVLEKEVSQEKEVEVESSKREGESLKQEIAKKQKIEPETEELKKHLQIVPDDNDDVYTDDTLLASKILIVDYKIHTTRNRPYFKIIRADGNYRLFLSFSTMLKNFDREDLESLWKIVRERFEKTEPKNYTDEFLLNTLKIMFEKPNVEANVWKDQKGKYGLAKVKRWKLFDSCGVHCLTFLTTQIFPLVEKMYPLTYFTLEQMVNEVRLIS
nr:hypothetical protein [Tanacetum cinerariifolium]